MLLADQGLSPYRALSEPSRGRRDSRCAGVAIVRIAGGLWRRMGPHTPGASVSRLQAVHDFRLGGGELAVAQSAAVVHLDKMVEFGSGASAAAFSGSGAIGRGAPTGARRSRSSRSASPDWASGNSAAVWRRSIVTPSASSAANRQIHAICGTPASPPRDEQQEQTAGDAVGHGGALAQAGGECLPDGPGGPGRAGEPRREREDDAVDDQRHGDREQQRGGDVPHLVHGGLVRRDLDERVDD